jgi:hypothetical protein
MPMAALIAREATVEKSRITLCERTELPGQHVELLPAQPI